MRRYLFVAALVTLVAFVFPGVGIAGDFMERIKNQQERIDKGIKSGGLTRQEADIVQDNLNRIKERHGRMKADEKLTSKEQEKLDHLLDMNSQMIENKKSHPVQRIDKE